MKPPREATWSAYLDGAMNDEDARAFESSLNEEERHRLDAEVRLEKRIAAKLSEEQVCPEDVWQDTVTSLPRRAPGTNLAATHRHWLLRALGALAAISVVSVAFLLLQVRYVPPEFMVLEPEDRAALSALSETYPDPDAVESYLAAHGFPLRVRIPATGTTSSETQIELIGARDTVYQESAVVEVYFQYGGACAKLVVAQQDSSPAAAMERHGAKGDVITVKHLGRFAVGLVARHDARVLLDALKPPE